ncbi:MAG TPA: alpha/beta hydrolase [Verrucomicrobiae bacterium]|nr:alpha/beta hydrolase [Verrucomicrobiae bacterium]
MARPIVFIHGMWCTGANFSRLVEILKARGHACYAPSLPAHEVGVEHPEVGTQSVADYLAFLEDYVRRQGFAEPPILIGHSMGGLLAQQLAARINPFALVLLTTAAPSGTFGLRLSNVWSFTPVALRWGWWRRPQKLSYRGYVNRAYNGVPVEKHRKLYEGMVEESGRVVLEIAFWFLAGGKATRVDASAIRCPVYIVSSGEDRLTPASVIRRLAAKHYPHASLRHWPHRGHWVLDDADTDEMTAEIANWLQGHEARMKRA